MTEDEWFEKKKLLKLLRERVRRAKKVKDDKTLEEHQNSLQSALDEQDKVHSQRSQLEDERKEKKRPKVEKGKAKAGKAKKDGPASPSPKGEVPARLMRAEPALPPKTKTVDKSFVNLKSKLQNGKQRTRRTGASSKPITGPAAVNLTHIFARDVTFNDHCFDSSELENPYETCPNGGPGGLICCEICTKNYSIYLSLTTKDIEQQKTRKVNREVSELLGFLTGAKAKLDEALRLVKQSTKGGPLHRQKAEAKEPQPSPIFNTVEPLHLDQDAMPQLPKQKLSLGEEALKRQNGSAVQWENLQVSQLQDDTPSVFQALVDPPSPVQLIVESLPEIDEGTTNATKKDVVEMVAV